MSPLAADSCLDIHLGDYNLFLLEDYTGGHLVGGRVAAGGNITLSDFSVGSELSADKASNTLVAGGDLTLTRGGFPGNAWYGGIFTHANLNCEPTCPVAQGLPGGFEGFEARFAELRNLSSRLARHPIKVDASFENDGIVMKLTGEDPHLNVFDVDASDLNRNSKRWSQWDFRVPAGSFVVVNIRGASLDFGYVSTESNGNVTAKRVLYNFVDATRITGSNVNFQGTLLAPKARVTFESGSLTGGLYAVSLSGAAFSANYNPLVEMTPEEACKKSGTTCGSALECLSGECVDGVCCNTACEGECDACNLTSHEGTCTPVALGSAGSPSCAPYVCGGSSASCPTSCTTDSECIAEDYCSAGACVPRLGNGEACSAANQCSSGNCVDGVCCNTACAGECDACNLPGHEGTCSPVPSTVQCRGAAGECDVAEYCTGTGANCPADGFQRAGTACTSDSNVCTVDVCNGTGSCGHPPETSCGMSYGAWGSCSGFSDYCDTTGTQSRTVTASTCGAGTCGPSSSSTETQECTRAAPDTSCAEPSYGEWSACSYSDTCAQTGTQRRTVRRYAYNCATGLCAESTTTETQACTRNTDGVQCRAAGVCDLAERCSGGTCPADSKMPAGTSCDDGKAGTTGDRCDGAGVCTGCGDGVRNGPEACDDGNTVTETSCPNGQASCTVCNATCTQVLNIQTSYCGDGVTNGSEACDYGNNSPCPYGQSCVQCNTSCTGYQYVSGPYCGDGVMNGPEACDYRNNTGCPYGQSCVQCNTSCTGYQYAPGPSCGDGVTNGPEACDYGNNMGCPYGESCFQCNTSCTGLEYVSGGYCGDGVTNGPEVCDYRNNSQCNTTCTGLITPPPPPGVCSSSDPVESLFIGWYQGYLHRCADAGGLAWWVEQYTSTTDRGCGPLTNVYDTARNSCFLSGFLDAARSQGEYP